MREGGPSRPPNLLPSSDSFLSRLARQAAQLSDAAVGEIGLLQGDLACAVASDNPGFHHVHWQGTTLESILNGTGLVTLQDEVSSLPPRLVSTTPASRSLACSGINLKDEHGHSFGALIVYYDSHFEPAPQHHAALSGIAGLIEVWVRELVAPRSETPSWVNSQDRGLPSFRCTTSLEGRILDVGPAWQAVTGLTPAASHGANLFELISESSRPALRRLLEKAAGGGSCWISALELAGRSGLILGPVSAFVLFRDGNPDRIFLSGWTTNQSSGPALQIPPRELLEDCVRSHLQAQPAGCPLLPIAVVDLDGFARVNELYGYEAGDQVLAAILERLRRYVGDSACVTRIGGDAFALTLPACATPEQALCSGQEILALVDEPVPCGAISITVSASIGISLAPLHGVEPDLLLRHAEAAVGQVKRRGKSHVSLFDLGWMAAHLERRRLEADLGRALLENQFRLLYQPEVSFTGKLVGLEALLEWQHPELGRLRPARFISIAEESGYIGRIGAWVLREALTRASAWNRRGILPARIAVNVSPLQLSRPDFAPLVESILAETGFPATSLELELTESALLDEPGEAARSMESLRALGVSLCLDDFGIGYSSLHNLKVLPIDTIKIDRSFVESLGAPSDALSLVHTLTILARNQGLRVIAEGVETEDQARHLVLTRCDLAQGYLFGMPLPWEETEELLLRLPAWPDFSQPECW